MTSNNDRICNIVNLNDDTLLLSHLLSVFIFISIEIYIVFHLYILIFLYTIYSCERAHERILNSILCVVSSTRDHTNNARPGLATTIT